MSENLKNFLKKLGEDPQVLERFRRDPHAVMDEHAISEEHKKLVLEGDKEKLKEESGIDDSQVNALIV